MRKQIFFKQLFENSLSFGGFKYIGVIIQLLATMVIARLLSPEEIGVIGLVTVFSGFFIMFAENGVTYIIIRSNYALIFWNSISALIIRIGILLFLIMLLLAYPIAIFYNTLSLISVIIIISFIFLIQPFGIVAKALLLKRQKFKEVGKAALLHAFLFSVFSVIFALFNFSYWSIVFATLIAKIGETFYFVKSSKYIPFFGTMKHVNAAWNKSKILMYNTSSFSTLNYWARNLDNLLIGKFHSVSDLGIYTKAYQLLTLILNLLRDTIDKVIFPMLKIEKEKGSDYQNHFLNGLRLISLLLIPVLILFVFQSENIVKILWGSKWLDAATIIPFFGILLYTQSLIRMSGNLILIDEHDNKFFKNGLGVMFSIIGIVYGSFESMFAIAKYYCLANISGTLLYSVIYGYRIILKMSWKIILSLWFPKIIFCLLLWTGLSYEIFYLKILSISLLTIHSIIDLKLSK